MAYRLCFILLATSVLVWGQREDHDEAAQKTTVAGESLLAYFYMSRVNSTFLQIRWNIEELVKAGVEEIKVTIEAASAHTSPWQKAASVTTGQVSLDDLQTNTLYEVHLQATGNGISLLSYADYVDTWPTAPSTIPPPEGRAISATEIELHWLEPSILNGILKPYRLTCLDAASKDVVTSVLTESNMTTSGTVGALHSDTLYQCFVKASTVPADGQNPAECESYSNLSSPIRTMPAGEKEGNVTTSGSAITSIISRVAFTCMVVVLS